MYTDIIYHNTAIFGRISRTTAQHPDHDGEGDRGYETPDQALWGRRKISLDNPAYFKEIAARFGGFVNQFVGFQG